MQHGHRERNENLRWGSSLITNITVEEDFVARVKAINQFERVHQHKNFTNIGEYLITAVPVFKLTKDRRLVKSLHIGYIGIHLVAGLVVGLVCLHVGGG